MVKRNATEGEADPATPLKVSSESASPSPSQQQMTERQLCLERTDEIMDFKLAARGILLELKLAHATSQT